MADVFVSYKSEDRKAAQRVASELEALGLDVWWDSELIAGDDYQTIIDRQLRTAKAVVVLWSKKSTQSRWVRSEATVADRQGTLVPALIEKCELPTAFVLVQTADLSEWKGDLKAAHWQAFVSAIVGRCGSRATPHAEPSDLETTFWSDTGNDRQIDSLVYLSRYPNGKFREQARQSASVVFEPNGDGFTVPFKDEPGASPTMLLVPEGRSVMGSPRCEAGRDIDEGPQQEIHIGGFAASRFPITEADIARWNPDLATGKSDRRHFPATGMTWVQAAQYAQWLSSKTGKPFRLLSEAEWEYIASGAGRFSGVDLTAVNADGRFSGPTPVDAHPPNALGFFDLLGNVWEWVADTYSESHVGVPADGTPRLGQGPKVLKGGCWMNGKAVLRPACRNSAEDSDRSDLVGFRVGLSL